MEACRTSHAANGRGRSLHALVCEETRLQANTVALLVAGGEGHAAARTAPAVADASAVEDGIAAANADTAQEASAEADVRAKRSARRLAAARASANARLSVRGHRDRKSGGYSLPEDDTKEPQRTERLLAAPFAWRRSVVSDAFQAREGYLLFRVNGGSCVGRNYRMLVVVVNMAFGVLSGMQPLLMPSGSVPAYVQTALIVALQLGMSGLCFFVLPDADRLISRFAATQFLLEGISTCVLLANSLRQEIARTASLSTTFALVGRSLVSQLCPM